MSTPTEKNKNQSQDQQRARLRNNQRNSRARKQAYLEELEKKWSACVRTGAEATVEMQAAARRVQSDNEILKAMLFELGVSRESVDQRLKAAGSAGLSNYGGDIAANKPCCPGESTSMGGGCGPSTVMKGRDVYSPGPLAAAPTVIASPTPLQPPPLMPAPKQSYPESPANTMGHVNTLGGFSHPNPANPPQQQQQTIAPYPSSSMATVNPPFDETWFTEFYDGSGELNQDFSDAFDAFIDPTSTQGQGMNQGYKQEDGGNMHHI